MGVEIAHWAKGSVILMNLVVKKTPAEARDAYEHNLIRPYSDDTIMSQLNEIGVMLYHHMKSSDLLSFHCGKVPSGRSTLGFFITELHKQAAPADNRASLVKLNVATRKPLAEWDNLYYALQAEIRLYYDVLQREFGFGTGSDNKIIHTHGPNGNSENKPYSALDMAVQLEQFWHALNDEHLIVGLDQALRIKNVKESSSETFEKDDDPSLLRLAAAMEPHHGLLNTHTTTPQRIALMLYAKTDLEFHLQMQRDLLKQQANTTDIRKRTLLCAARAETRHAVRAARKKASKVKIGHSCTCHGDCLCKAKCMIQPTNYFNCRCAHARNEIRELVGTQREVELKIKQDAEAVGILTPTSATFLDAPNNEDARMQVAAVATADPYIVWMCKIDAQEAAMHDEEANVLLKSRSRPAGSHSEFAIFPPPKAPDRAKKGQDPLSMYDDKPGPRHPQLGSGITADHQVFNSAQVPPRKPVPQISFEHRALTYGEEQMCAPPTHPSNPSFASDVTSPFSSFNSAVVDQSFESMTSHTPEKPRPSQGSYRGMPPACPSDSDWQNDPFFPTGHTNPEDSPSMLKYMSPRDFQPLHGLDVNVPVSEYAFLASDARREHNPFRETIEMPLQSTDYAAFPETSAQQQMALYLQRQAPFRSNTFAPGDDKALRSPAIQQKFRSEDLSRNKPYPHLPPSVPLPDFINPRPAVIQRYVSAGGHAKLHERAEIPAPIAPTMTIIGGTMSKAAMFERLNDPDFIQQNLANSRSSTERRSAERIQCISSEERNSAERSHLSSVTPLWSSSPSGRSSPPRSKRAGDKHDRQPSSGSMSGKHFAKLRRVFSSSHSGSSQ